MKIFISYSAKYNKDIAGSLKQCFEEYEGIDCFVAHDDIPHGFEWEKEILQNLETANIFIPLQTAELTNSFWCQQEAGIAFAKQIRIVPFIPDVGGTDPIGFYSRYQGYKIKVGDLRGSVKLWLIKEGIISDNNAEEIDKRIMIFAASDSYAEAGETTRSLLELESQFTRADIIRIFEITLNNGQVASSFSAYPLLKRMFVKYSSILPKDKLEEFLKYQ